MTYSNKFHFTDKRINVKHLSTCKFVFILFLMLAIIQNTKSQTTIFNDAFQYAASPGRTSLTTTGQVPFNMTYAVLRTVNTTSATYSMSSTPHEFILNSGTPSGTGYIFAHGIYSAITTTTSLNDILGNITWQVNFRTSKSSQLTGFTGSNYSGAIVLAATSANIQVGGDANGYAIYYTKSSISGSLNNRVSLVKFTGGLGDIDANHVILAESPDITLSDGTTGQFTIWQSVKVVYNPFLHEWKLYHKNEGTATDDATYGFPQSATKDLSLLANLVGTATDNTYTGVAISHFAYYWNHSNAAGSFRIDNFSIGVDPTTYTQASTLSLSPIGSSTATINWNRGNGNKVAVFIKEGSSTATAVAPSYGLKFTANADWAIKGTELSAGTGWYCVYNGTGTSVDLTNLTANTPYTAQVVEYLGNDLFANNYYSTSIPTIGGTTLTTLPVSLISFSAKKQNNNVSINWSTSSEQNNSHFKISQSKDGQNFNLLSIVKSATNGNIKNTYSYIDVKPVNGTNYYQLEQVDLNGTITNLGLNVVNFGLNVSSTGLAYPNPTQNEVKVNFEQATYTTAKLINLNGAVLINKIIASNDSDLIFDMRTLPVGNYIIQLEGKTTSIQKVAKQ
jgi:hypothetical protein